MASKKAGAGGASGGGTECVKVAVRVRPLNSKERDAGEVPCVTVDSARAQVVVVKPGESTEDTKPFTFDYTYGADSTQEKVFQETAQPIVDSVLAGYNGTMFAYGQTGTGKTHTMEGVMDDEKLRGVMPNSFHYIMAAVKNTGKNVEFLVRMSFLEIYKEEVFDLLNKAERKKAEVRENPESGVFVDGLSTYVVKSVDDMMKVLKRGQKSRKVGATAMNAGSSRSHSILTIIVETSEVKDADEAKAAAATAAPGAETKSDTKYRAGKLNLVDLAGSERQKKTAAEGERLLEAKSINQSLSALGNVIKALVNAKATHIPFRDSKLTRLLQDSLGGNTKTVMIAALGPSAESWDETMSTLRYADRAKNIKNKPRVNEDPKDTMLRECQEEISRLKAALEARARSMGPDGLMLAAPNGGSGGAPGAPGAPAGPPVIHEEIVEKEVVVDTGIREEHLTELEKKALEEAEHFNQKTEAEKQIILERKQIAEETARRFEEDLKAKNELMEKERAEFAAIQQRIADREKQLMSGGVELEKAAAQKKELKRAEAELNARREREAQLKRELQKAQDDELFMNETFKTAEEEVANKTQKMKQLMAKYTEKKQEIDDLQEDFEVEREDLVDTIRALDRQIKLKHLVLDAFVPPHYVEMIEQRALFDERGDTWIIPGVELACNNIRRDLAPGGAASAGAAIIGGAGAGGGGGPSGRMFRRPPTPNWARLGGSQLMAGAGRGMPFDPTRPLELPPDMQQALAAAMQAEDGPRAPKDMYYTYGGAGAEQTEDAGRGRRKRR